MSTDSDCNYIGDAHTAQITTVALAMSVSADILNEKPQQTTTITITTTTTGYKLELEHC